MPRVKAPPRRYPWPDHPILRSRRAPVFSLRRLPRDIRHIVFSFWCPEDYDVWACASDSPNLRILRSSPRWFTRTPSPSFTRWELLVARQRRCVVSMAFNDGQSVWHYESGITPMASRVDFASRYLGGIPFGEISVRAYRQVAFDVARRPIGDTHWHAVSLHSSIPTDHCIDGIPGFEPGDGGTAPQLLHPSDPHVPTTDSRESSYGRSLLQRGRANGHLQHISGLWFEPLAWCFKVSPQFYRCGTPSVHDRSFRLHAGIDDRLVCGSVALPLHSVIDEFWGWLPYYGRHMRECRPFAYCSRELESRYFVGIEPFFSYGATPYGDGAPDDGPWGPRCILPVLLPSDTGSGVQIKHMALEAGLTGPVRMLQSVEMNHRERHQDLVYF